MGFAVILDGTEHRLRGKAALIGRHASCKVRIDHPSVSRKHARLVFKDDLPKVVDLDSPNGVFVNDERIVEEQRLNPGDVIRIGTHELQFLLVADTDTPPAESSIPEADDVLGGGDLTAVNDAMAFVCTSARRLLDSGEVESAAFTLRQRWPKIMARSHAVHPALTIYVARTAFRVAAAVKEASWANDAAVMLASADQIPNEDTLADVEMAVAAVGMTAPIRTYLDAVGKNRDGLTEPACASLERLKAKA